MSAYRMTILLPAGRRTIMQGLYSSSWAGIDAALAIFPNAVRVSARRI